MKFFSRLFAPCHSTNLVTTLERQRLAKTMPGQTGAIAACASAAWLCNEFPAARRRIRLDRRPRVKPGGGFVLGQILRR